MIHHDFAGGGVPALKGAKNGLLLINRWGIVSDIVIGGD